jgi:hypothetical protein
MSYIEIRWRGGSKKRLSSPILLFKPKIHKKAAEFVIQIQHFKLDLRKNCKTTYEMYILYSNYNKKARADTKETLHTKKNNKLYININRIW